MEEIGANEIKVRGIGAVEDALANGDEAAVTHRGKVRFLALSREYYGRLKEYQLAGEIAETQREIKKGTYKGGTVESHIKRIGL